MSKAQTTKNNGFSLLELMIAMTLGLFLVAGVGTVYLSSKQSYKLRDQISELDENARVALRVLTQHIEHAGYASTSGMVIANYILPTSETVSGTSCSDGNSNISKASIINTTQDGTAGDSDTIGVMFMADNQLSNDCSGTTRVDASTGKIAGLRSECLPPNVAERSASMVYNSFSIGATRQNLVGDAIPELRCGGSLRGVVQPWAEGVDNLQFQYGVDLNADGAVDNYWNATVVDENSVWAQIISVRIGVLIRSVEPAFDDEQSQSFQVLDQKIDKTNTRYKFGVYATTVRLKNVARRSE